MVNQFHFFRQKFLCLRSVLAYLSSCLTDRIFRCTTPSFSLILPVRMPWVQPWTELFRLGVDRKKSCANNGCNKKSIGYMGLVYMPIHLPSKLTVHVGEYTLRPMDTTGMGNESIEMTWGEDGNSPRDEDGVWRTWCKYCYGNPQPSFLGVIISHIIWG